MLYMGLTTISDDREPVCHGCQALCELQVFWCHSEPFDSILNWSICMEVSVIAARRGDSASSKSKFSGESWESAARRATRTQAATSAEAVRAD